MKVVHIITNLGDGGAEGVLFRLATSDTRATHSVISLMGQGKYGPMLADLGVEVHCLGMEHGRVSLAGFLRLIRLIRGFQPAVVQTWMYHADLVGGVASRLAGASALFWGVRHSTLEKGRSKRSTIFVARICARLSRVLPTGIIYCARKASDVHVALGYDAAKTFVVPNGYNLSVFRPDREKGLAFRRELGISPNELLLGMVGRYDPQKDHLCLLQALSRLKRDFVPFTCVLVGRGLVPDNTLLVEVIESLGLADNVVLLGPRTDIPSVMNGIDLHVLSSAFGEAFPNVLAEAMACGTCCVTTDVGDAAAIVGGGGWVVPPSDPEALYSAIRDSLPSLQNDEVRYDMEKYARTRMISNFTLKTMVNGFHSAWETRV